MGAISDIIIDSNINMKFNVYNELDFFVNRFGKIKSIYDTFSLPNVNN
jgi:hypothetical protein